MERAKGTQVRRECCFDVLRDEDVQSELTERKEAAEEVEVRARAQKVREAPNAGSR